ncbi:hypothetical protein AYL99_09829 [Fonsecaea erecta]|uniref:Uncharacterized protein n=1 Tax=Fonsecaea erecta TaxID=1367422 RepID=A0A178Z7E0_9EURO|nr:hypothetical protein AYL99_09829 [Fonsecaea erecta]OAP55677.1 hypothetical protein AYL99_09829 [Fonsecaea erecta]
MDKKEFITDKESQPTYSTATAKVNNTMGRKELITYEEPRSGKETLETLEGTDEAREGKDQEATIMTQQIDLRTLQQLSSSGAVAQVARNRK